MTAAESKAVAVEFLGSLAWIELLTVVHRWGRTEDWRDRDGVVTKLSMMIAIGPRRATFVEDVRHWLLVWGELYRSAIMRVRW